MRINEKDVIVVREAIRLYEELTGNACTIEIKYDVTKIVNEYAEEDQKPYCLIETAELKQILLKWDDAVRNKYAE
ncbi:hypothetical protein ACQKGA_25365 [Priestia megaterium]|uniref:hypothetical protein n=1 Tax=Priestia megaterium TaxID=1404 RepID=UPI003CC20272